MKNVVCEKETRDRARAEKKWIITIAVDGKHLKDDALCVQVLADLPTAQKLAKLAAKLLNREPVEVL